MHPSLGGQRQRGLFLFKDNCMNPHIYTAALIGTGRIGFSLGLDKKREQPASHTMALLSNKRIRLVAGCDLDGGRLEEWGRFTKVSRRYASADKLFAGELAATGSIPDIITVAVNEAAHHDTALAALESGPRLVVLEKPVALNSKLAEAIRAAAERHKVPVLINHERRFARDYNLARHLTGQIGDLQQVTASLHSGLRVYSAKEEGTGFYSLIHDGTHLVDIVRFLLGDTELDRPVLSGVHWDGDKMLRNMSVTYSCKICPSVQFNISGRSKFFGFEVDILGTTGRIVLGNGFFQFFQSRESRLYSGFRSLEPVEGSFSYQLNGKTQQSCLKKGRFVGKTGYFSGMVQNAVDFLDGRASLGSNLTEGIATLKLLEEMKSLVLEGN